MEKNMITEEPVKAGTQDPPPTKVQKQSTVMGFFSSMIQTNKLKPEDHKEEEAAEKIETQDPPQILEQKQNTVMGFFSSVIQRNKLKPGDHKEEEAVEKIETQDPPQILEQKQNTVMGFFSSIIQRNELKPGDHKEEEAAKGVTQDPPQIQEQKHNTVMGFFSSMIKRKEEEAEKEETQEDLPQPQVQKQNMMMDFFSNKIQSNELKPGDHIYSWRHNYLYSHHGIYIGDEKVIHFTRAAGQEVGTGTFLDNILFSSSPANSSSSPCPRCGDQSKDSGVISSCLECFLNGGELYKFQYGVSSAVFLARVRGGTCTLAVSDPAEQVIYRAEYLLQNGFGGYDIFKNNCEDFTIYCKTGLLIITSVSLGRSGQATSFVAAATALVSSPLRFMTTSFPGLAVVGCGIYCISRFVSDIGMRRDVIKVPVERLVARPCLVECPAAAELSNDGELVTCKDD